LLTLSAMDRGDMLCIAVAIYYPFIISIALCAIDFVL